MNCMSLLQTSTQLAQHDHLLGHAEISKQAAAVIIFILVFVLLTLVLPWYFMMFGHFSQHSGSEIYRNDADLRQAFALMKEEDCLGRTTSANLYESSKLRTTLFDTYSISSGLICSVAATTFFIDNRAPETILENTQVVSLRYTIRGLYQILVALSTSFGLYAFMIFVLCAMYARVALCKPVGGVWLYLYVLEVTQTARKFAFFAMYLTAILCVLALCLHAMSNNVFTSVHDLPREVIDITSVVVGFLILGVFFLMLYQTQWIMKKVTILFFSDDEIKLIHDSMWSDSSSRKPTP